MSEDNRNTIIFVVSAAVILIVYQTFVLGPASKKREAELAQERAVAAQVAQTNTQLGPNGVSAVAPTLSRDQAKTASPRVTIDTPALAGSISLRGARIDDLFLKTYRVTVDPKSTPVELLRPQGASDAWFADFGWTGSNVPGLPGPATLWTVESGSVLSPGKPVTLTYDNGAGLKFARVISVDKSFMFSVADSVSNQGGTPIALAPYASIQRQGLPQDIARNGVVHEGAVGALGDGKNPSQYQDRLWKYAKWKKDGIAKSYTSNGGWIGITDKYWLSALIPQGMAPITGQYRVVSESGVDIYDANFVGATKTVIPGQALFQTTHLFAGAKSVPMLRAYEKELKIPRFDFAVDWGMFWFFTRPIFTLLDFFYTQVGNFGVAILLLTVTVKLLFFPLANKSYESMTKMRKAQPQIEEVRARYKDDPAKQQQEIMALYKTERINPMTGCLPMLIQIPVFYALYKVLNVTIEMRHAPFAGWINDLSARDSTTIWNLFGLIPYDPSLLPLIGTFLNGPLHVGLLGIAYGVTMWLTTAMNPPAPDPMQQKIFQWMPVIFTFTLSQVAVGLMIYWAWNNVLSIIQQYVIMRRFKVDNPIDSVLARLSGKKPQKASG